VPKVHRVRLVPLVKMATRASKALKVHQASKALKVHKAKEDTEVLLVLKA
jgi:hypothetical protein